MCNLKHGTKGPTDRTERDAQTWRTGLWVSEGEGEEVGWMENLGLLDVNYFIYLFIFLLFRAAPTANGGSQARSLNGATAASLYYSHSNTRSEPCLWPTTQVEATLDP